MFYSVQKWRTSYLIISDTVKKKVKKLGGKIDNIDLENMKSDKAENLKEIVKKLVEKIEKVAAENKLVLVNMKSDEVLEGDIVKTEGPFSRCR